MNFPSQKQYPYFLKTQILLHAILPCMYSLAIWRCFLNWYSFHLWIIVSSPIHCLWFLVFSLLWCLWVKRLLLIFLASERGETIGFDFFCVCELLVFIHDFSGFLVHECWWWLYEEDEDDEEEKKSNINYVLVIHR